MATLAQISEQLIPLFAAQLTEQGVDVPERQYFAPGQIPAQDGEQLVANLVGVMQGQPGVAYSGTFPGGGIGATFSATFSVALLRAIPVVMAEPGGIDFMVPTADDIDEAAQSFIGDTEALLKAAQAIHHSYQVTDPGMGFEVGPLQTIGPEGGLAGPKMLVTVSLG